MSASKNRKIIDMHRTIDERDAEIERQRTVIVGYERIYNDAMRALRETVDERDRLRRDAAAAVAKEREQWRLPDEANVAAWHENEAYAQSDKDYCAGWNACLYAICVLNPRATPTEPKP